MGKSVKKKLVGLAAAALMLSAASAQAIPTLQLYIDGGTYDTATETWTTNSNHFDLWVIGNGADEPIYDVFLSAAFKTAENTSGHSITVTDKAAGSTLGIAGSGSGTAPLMGNNAPLPDHGVYGATTSWNTYGLGTFTSKTSHITDFQPGFVIDPNGRQFGQISKYTVDIAGFTDVHFDAFDHVASATGGKFKKVEYTYVNDPFSHDAEGGSAPVPEPGTMMLVGAGFLGLAIYGKRRRQG